MAVFKKHNMYSKSGTKKVAKTKMILWQNVKKNL